MAEAVTSFISGAVPAVALWVPFDVTVQAEGAERAASSSMRRPSIREAAIMGGWAAHGRLPCQEPRGAACASSGLGARQRPISRATPTQALEALQKTQYTQVPLADFKDQFEGLEVLHVGRVAQALRRRHGDQVAAAGHRLLRHHRQHPQPGAGVAVLRSLDLPGRHQGLIFAVKGLRLHHRRRRFGRLRARTGCRRTRASRVPIGGGWRATAMER